MAKVSEERNQVNNDPAAAGALDPVGFAVARQKTLNTER